MSIRATSIIWAHAPYSSNQLLVLMKMGDHANDDGGDVYPAIPSLAKAARVSTRTVQRIIQQLIDDGAITHVGEKRLRTAGGAQSVNEYKINLRWLVESGDKKPAVPVDNSADQGEKGGDKMSPPTPKGVTKNAKGGDIAVSPKPSINPQDNINKGEKKLSTKPMTGFGDIYNMLKGAGIVFNPTHSKTRELTQTILELKISEAEFNEAIEHPRYDSANREIW